MPRALVIALLFVALASIGASIASLTAPMTVHAAASTANGPAHSVRCGPAFDLLHSDFDSEGFDDGKCLPKAKRRFVVALGAGGSGLAALAALVFLSALTANRRAALAAQA